MADPGRPKTLRQLVAELSKFLPEHGDKLVIHEDDWSVITEIKGPVPPDKYTPEELAATIALTFRRHEWFPKEEQGG